MPFSPTRDKATKKRTRSHENNWRSDLHSLVFWKICESYFPITRSCFTHAEVWCITFSNNNTKCMTQLQEILYKYIHFCESICDKYATDFGCVFSERSKQELCGTLLQLISTHLLPRHFHEIVDIHLNFLKKCALIKIYYMLYMYQIYVTILLIFYYGYHTVACCPMKTCVQDFLVIRNRTLQKY